MLRNVTRSSLCPSICLIKSASEVEILLAVTICSLHSHPRKESNGHQKKMPSLPTHGSPQPLATGNYTPMAEDAGRSDATGTIPKDGK